jgi:hypothetical protein
MAREAGFKVDWQHADVAEIKAKRYEYFAELVAAREREKVAAWMMRQGYATGHGDTVEDLLQELDWQIREQEREACAELCDEKVDAEYKTGKVDHHEMGWTQACAIAIRARGEAEYKRGEQ